MTTYLNLLELQVMQPTVRHQPLQTSHRSATPRKLAFAFLSHPLCPSSNN
mgnify:CR=1 FL=1